MAGFGTHQSTTSSTSLLFFATPAIWYPDQSTSDWQTAITQMLARSFATADMVAGRLDIETYLDLLADQGLDVNDLVAGWELQCSM